MENTDLTEKSGTYEIYIFFSYIKMGKEVLTFGDIKIEKKKFFYRHKSPIFFKIQILKKY